MKEINCQHLHNILLDFIDKKLDSDTTHLVTDHLKACNSCNAELERTLVLLQDIQLLSDEEAPESMRNNFLRELETAKLTNKPGLLSQNDNVPRKLWLYNPFSQIAAGLAILISGVLLGFLLNNKNTDEGSVTELKSQVQDMKSMLFMAKLDQPSASQRIQAVNFTNEIRTPDPQVIDALVRTMDTDDNINVRMASIHALARFSEISLVRDALVTSLSKQDDPLIQITLINILVEIQEKKAIDTMRKLLQKEETIDAVKQMAEKGLTTFI